MTTFLRSSDSAIMSLKFGYGFWLLTNAVLVSHNFCLCEGQECILLVAEWSVNRDRKIMAIYFWNTSLREEEQSVKWYFDIPSRFFERKISGRDRGLWDGDNEPTYSTVSASRDDFSVLGIYATVRDCSDDGTFGAEIKRYIGSGSSYNGL
jgi:hypothetical protein